MGLCWVKSLSQLSTTWALWRAQSEQLEAGTSWFPTVAPCWEPVTQDSTASECSKRTLTEAAAWGAQCRVPGGGCVESGHSQDNGSQPVRPWIFWRPAAWLLAEDLLFPLHTGQMGRGPGAYRMHLVGTGRCLLQECLEDRPFPGLPGLRRSVPSASSGSALLRNAQLSR